jgi:predicted nucleic acid-binding Zn ribbon protein
MPRRRVSHYEDQGPRRLAPSLDALSRTLGGGAAAPVGHLFARWPDLVGATVAAHVRPVRLDAEVLVVAVDHPAWATQVRRMERELLDRVSEETGAARPGRLEVRVRP